MADNPHTGHRRRTMEKLRRFGMGIFADHEALEILLYFAVRQGDTNPVAHRLLDRFGSLHAVFEAPAEQLWRGRGRRPAHRRPDQDRVRDGRPLSGGRAQNGGAQRPAEQP